MKEIDDYDNSNHPLRTCQATSLDLHKVGTNIIISLLQIRSWGLGRVSNLSRMRSQGVWSWEVVHGGAGSKAHIWPTPHINIYDAGTCSSLRAEGVAAGAFGSPSPLPWRLRPQVLHSWGARVPGDMASFQLTCKGCDITANSEFAHSCYWPGAAVTYTSFISPGNDTTLRQGRNQALRSQTNGLGWVAQLGHWLAGLPGPRSTVPESS